MAVPKMLVLLKAHLTAEVLAIPKARSMAMAEAMDVPKLAIPINGSSNGRPEGTFDGLNVYVST